MTMAERLMEIYAEISFLCISVYQKLNCVFLFDISIGGKSMPIISDIILLALESEDAICNFEQQYNFKPAGQNQLIYAIISNHLHQISCDLYYLNKTDRTQPPSIVENIPASIGLFLAGIHQVPVYLDGILTQHYSALPIKIFDKEWQQTTTIWFNIHNTRLKHFG